MTGMYHNALQKVSCVRQIRHECDYSRSSAELFKNLLMIQRATLLLTKALILRLSLMSLSKAV